MCYRVMLQCGSDNKQTSMALVLFTNGGKSRAPSPFLERVLFLITQPTSCGDVERFFSHCGTISKQQHELDDNVRRLWFMLYFHGDVEGRLL